MKKINTLSIALKQSMDVLTVSQMSLIRGGASTTVSDLVLPDVAAVGALSATDDDKRRDRPGGGISTH